MAWSRALVCGTLLLCAAGGGCAAIEPVSIRTIGPVAVDLHVWDDDEPELTATFTFSEHAEINDEDDCERVDVAVGFDDTTLEEGLDGETGEWGLGWGTVACYLDAAHVPLDDDDGSEGTLWLESAGERFEVDMFLPPGGPELRAVEPTATDEDPAVLELSGYELTEFTASFDFRAGGHRYSLGTDSDVDVDRVEVHVGGRASDEEACPEGCSGSFETEYGYRLRVSSCEGFATCTNDTFYDYDSVDGTWIP